MEPDVGADPGKTELGKTGISVPGYTVFITYHNLGI
jgi:hypothetical protein